MKDQKVGIKQLLEVSTDLPDLEKRLTRAGFVFDNRKDLEIFLRKEWIKANKKEILEIKKQPLMELSELPYTEVEREGVKYRIHGIIHSSMSSRNNFLYPSVKNFIIDNIKNYKNFPEEDFLIEEGFAALFDLDKKNEMTHSVALALKKTGLDYFPNNFRGFGSQIANKFNFLFPEKYDYDSALNRQKELFKASNNLKYFSKAKKIFYLYNLPEPFHLQLKQTAEDLWENAIVNFSEVMTEYLLARAFVNPELKIIHAVVGLSHESEIVYFLKTLE